MRAGKAVRVVMADDNVVVRQGVRGLLEASGRVEVVAEAGNGQEALALAAEHRPDVVVLDVRMPVMGGVEAAGLLSGEHRVMMLTYAEDEELVTGAIRAGASGYLVHGRFAPEELVSAVEGVAEGKSPVSPAVVATVFAALRDGGSAPTPEPAAEALSPREREVMALLCEGRTNAEIARELFLSAKTVKNHVNRIYAKLGVATRGEAVARWLGLAGERR